MSQELVKWMARICPYEQQGGLPRQLTGRDQLLLAIYITAYPDAEIEECAALHSPSLNKNLPAHAGAQVNAEKGIHRGLSGFPLLPGLGIPTTRRPVADNKQSTATTPAKHCNRRVPVTSAPRRLSRSGCPNSDFVLKGSPVGLSRRAKKPASFYRSSYKRRTTREDGYCLGPGTIAFRAVLVSRHHRND
jgi:hypothetical protein